MAGKISLVEDGSKKCFRTWDVLLDGVRVGTIQERVASMGLTRGQDDGQRLAWGRDINLCLGTFPSAESAIDFIMRSV